MKIKWFRVSFPLVLFFWATMTFAQHNPKSWGDLGNGRYRNMILPADYSDPDVLRMGTGSGTSSDLAQKPCNEVIIGYGSAHHITYAIMH